MINLIIGFLCSYISCCRIDNGVIKVSDFGMAEDMYSSNYYRHSRSDGGGRVPVRWMAPESIETKVYNESTDIVSWLLVILINNPYISAKGFL